MTTMDRDNKLTSQWTVVTDDGTQGELREYTEFIRVQYVDGSWSEPQPGLRRLFFGRIPVNLLEDGSWETAESPPRRLTRRP